jgi:hypothetical protein
MPLLHKKKSLNSFGFSEFGALFFGGGNVTEFQPRIPATVENTLSTPLLLQVILTQAHAKKSGGTMAPKF